MVKLISEKTKRSIGINTLERTTTKCSFQAFCRLLAQILKFRLFAKSTDSFHVIQGQFEIEKVDIFFEMLLVVTSRYDQNVFL